MVVAIVAVVATSASASQYTCTNTVDRVNGEYVYTYSQCGDNPPASQRHLDLMSEMANNPNDSSAAVVDNTDAINELKKERRKLNRQIDRLKTKRDNAASKNKRKKLTDKIRTKKQERKAINQQIKALQ